MKSTSFLPDYSGNSIVNLMSSIRAIYGNDHLYPLLDGFDIGPFKDKNIVFIVIDALGYNLLMEYGDDTFLKKHTIRKMTSVFPSSTASAYISLITGVAPQQHGLIGWFMYLRETGIITSILPFITKAGGIPLRNIPFTDIFDQDTAFTGLDAASYSIIHKSYANSQCSASITKGSKKKAYSDIKGFFSNIENILDSGDNRKFIFAYWDQIDKIAHEKGIKSNETLDELKKIDTEISKLALLLNKYNASLIVTSDHGMVDSSERNTIRLSDHPILNDTLTLPLTGDPRVAYCYVKSHMEMEFEQYIAKNLEDCCHIYKSRDIIEKGFFGLYEPNRKLYQRTGDYTLVMKKNYMIREALSGEKNKELIGIHGGLTEDEMFSPLIVI
ncbi:MAG: alkaline phosphatase family protein [Deltaproteobacteria bacterium]|nr:alkaline phosphatase family protein [Deltaproteobacteria bacterium]